MSNRWLQFAFLIALFGTLGSLFFSEVMKFPPCTLCWYQRVCLYPLVPVFGAALWSGDRGYVKYALPLAAFGFLIAAYHNLVYYGWISEALTPCTQGVSCSTRQLELLGFITIPLLSVLGFVAILALMSLDTRRSDGR